MNYLAQFPGQNLGLPVLSNARLANPTEWMKASDAYIRLLADASEHARAFNRIDDFINTGQDLSEALSLISLVPDGGGVRGNTELFDAILLKYREAVQDFDAAVTVFEQQYVAANMQLPQSGGFLDPWLAADQQTSSWLPSVPNLPPPFPHPDLFVPPNGVINELPDLYAVADDLGTRERHDGHQRCALERMIVRTLAETQFTVHPNHQIASWEPTFADLVIDVDLRFDGATVLRATGRFPTRRSVSV